MLSAGAPVLAGDKNGGVDGKDGEESDDNPFELSLKTGVAWESNIFQVNERRERAAGDGLTESKMELSLPLDGKDGVFSATFQGEAKTYFSHSYVNEYLVQPGLAWRAYDVDDTKITLNVHAGWFSERVYTEFQRAPNEALPGVYLGGGGALETELSDRTTLTVEEKLRYQYFTNTGPDNFQSTTKVEAAMEWRDGLKFTGGTEWSYQNYTTRPSESAGLSNPRGLQMLEGRIVTGLDVELGAGWFLEAALTGGPRIDLTNGYYDAAVLGSRLELRWERNQWTVKLTAEPEWVRFFQRPANSGEPSPKLATQEYTGRLEVEYAWSKRLTFIAGCAAHFQAVNADQSRDDATLNSYLDKTVSLGVSYSY